MNLKEAISLRRPLTQEEYLSLSLEDREALIIMAEQAKQNEETSIYIQRIKEAKELGQNIDNIRDTRRIPLFMCHWIPTAYPNDIVHTTVLANEQLAAMDERYEDPRCCKYFSKDRFNCTNLKGWLECEQVVLTQILNTKQEQ